MGPLRVVAPDAIRNSADNCLRELDTVGELHTAVVAGGIDGREAGPGVGSGNIVRSRVEDTLKRTNITSSSRLGGSGARGVIDTGLS